MSSFNKSRTTKPKPQASVLGISGPYRRRWKELPKRPIDIPSLQSQRFVVSLSLGFHSLSSTCHAQSGIQILAVAPHHKAPGYWRGRI
jgi:hypothetical protein